MYDINSDHHSILLKYVKPSLYNTYVYNTYTNCILRVNFKYIPS